jgi:hypothetical protein
MWILTNKANQFSINELTFAFYAIGSECNTNNHENHQKKWLVFGHVFARYNQNIQVCSLQGLELVEYMYLLYSDDFIRYITGQFIIIHLVSNNFTIYSDHFAIKKFFIWQKGKRVYSIHVHNSIIYELRN